MVLHVLPKEKFTKEFIEFINNNFNKEEHYFLVINNKNKYNVLEQDNVKIVEENFNGMKYIKRGIRESDKAILHGIFSRKLILLLYFNQNLVKKCFWVIWGGDLYQYERRNSTFKLFIIEMMKKSIIKKIKGIISQIQGEYELAKKYYNTKAKFYYSFMYLSNTFKETCDKVMNYSDNYLNIMVGNSADPSNNHIEVFSKLKKYKDENIRVICPISYGDTLYRDTVIKNGIDIFGSKFVYIDKFIPFEKYLEILNSIDIAIFNHKRQQAVGNITTLLGLGKTVYIRDDITTWQFCLQYNLKVYSTNNELNNIVQKLDKIDANNNIKIIKREFSEEKLKSDLEKIFRLIVK